MTHSNRLLATGSLIVAALMLPACTTQCRETFTGHDADHVWTAMVAVAKTPDYNSPQYTQRWIVRENNVWVDDEERHIEIQRRLERDLFRPGAKPEHQLEDWKFGVMLIKSDPPEVQFITRQMVIPAHAWDEADRYFAEVWNVLNGGVTPAQRQMIESTPIVEPRSAWEKPEPAKPAPAPPATQPQKPDQKTIDIDTLDPTKP